MWRRGGAARLWPGRNEHVGALLQAALKEAERAGPPVLELNVLAMVTLAEAAQAVLSYVKQHVAEPRKVPLCGNSIATDRWFIARDMPELDAYLHYRMVDVSSIKELARRWYPRVYFASPGKHGGHRALADIKESVQELRYYREALFVPQPGPDSATARAIAARYS